MSRAPSSPARADSPEQQPFELIEEAFHLVRLAPLQALGAYYLGALPFMLGLLYFWSDMSRSAFAGQRLLPGAVVLSLLFVWMKGWQSVYARLLLARLGSHPLDRGIPSLFVDAAVAQAFVQTVGLFVLPFSLVLMFPFGWCYAFFTAATVVHGTESPTLRAALARSGRQAFLWPLQNHYLISLFLLFGLFVFFNLFTALLGVPFLLKTLLGIESVFTRSPWAALNGTLLAAQIALTYLCLDPVVKAAYVLRCFRGESLRTGEDLRAELRAIAAERAATLPPVGHPEARRPAAPPTSAPAGFAAAAPAAPGSTRPGPGTISARTLLGALAPASLGLGLALGLTGALPQSALAAAEPGGAAPAPTEDASGRRAGIAPDRLEESMARTIRQREYSWRLPPAPEDQAGNGSQTGAGRIGKQIEEMFKSMGRWISDALDWLFNRFRTSTPTPGGPKGQGVATVMEVLLILLIALLLGAILWLVFRLWQNRSTAPAVTAAPVVAAPDLADESVSASELPEDGWLRLARELRERGELRLALRALYLAGLSHLGERNLVTIARFKSNRDYERELLRRAHALADLPERFSESITVFERVWYGRHEATADLLDRLDDNLRRMRGAGGAPA